MTAVTFDSSGSLMSPSEADVVVAQIYARHCEYGVVEGLVARGAPTGDGEQLFLHTRHPHHCRHRQTSERLHCAVAFGDGGRLGPLLTVG